MVLVPNTRAKNIVSCKADLKAGLGSYIWRCSMLFFQTQDTIPEHRHPALFQPRLQSPSVALPVPPSDAFGVVTLNMLRIFPSGRPRRRSKSNAVDPCESTVEGSARERTNNWIKYSSPRSQAAWSALRPPLPGVTNTAKRKAISWLVVSREAHPLISRKSDGNPRSVGVWKINRAHSFPLFQFRRFIS